MNGRKIISFNLIQQILDNIFLNKFTFIQKAQEFYCNFKHIRPSNQHII